MPGILFSCFLRQHYLVQVQWVFLSALRTPERYWRIYTEILAAQPCQGKSPIGKLSKTFLEICRSGKMKKGNG